MVQSHEGILDVIDVRGTHAGDRVDLLVEVPHGATRARDYESTRAQLIGEFPADLVQFFFVNTDVGAPEVAEAVARRTVERHPRRHVRVLLGRVPRTFVDLNRAVDGDRDALGQAGLTPPMPGYVTRPEDRAKLAAMHRTYHDAAVHAFEEVCGSGGHALVLHTYAPRSVGITDVGPDIVERLHEAYRPEVYATWPRRPQVDLITEDTEGRSLTDPDWAQATVDAYARIGIEATRNESYRLHPATLGHVHAARHPGRVLCLELNRGLLADPFEPFVEMTIGAAKVDRMTGPLVDALPDPGV